MSHIDMAGVIGSFCQTASRMATFHRQEVTIDMQAWRGRDPLLCRLLCRGFASRPSRNSPQDRSTVDSTDWSTGHIVFDAPFIGELPELRT